MRLKIATSVVLSLLAAFFMFGASKCTQGNSNFQIEGVTGPSVIANDGGILINTAFKNITIEGEVRIVPDPEKFPNSYVEIKPDLTSEGTLVTIHIDFLDLLEGDFSTENPLTLPGGRPLPGVAAGTLPAIAFTIEEFHNMTFYMGPEVFGVFIPSNLGIEGTILSYRFYSGDGQRVGNMSVVSNDVNGENGGLLLMMDLSWIRGEHQRRLPVEE
ncbi:MAG: hypothetical protein A2504_14490 [Bdellovibrionales bacterium RIFOXYD12_FULL_39_22]|nr:MAG: hypothetical protein A2385_03975 [Bdellovibrionales bacterium RIFOXYB1_FULL_39_21]OFZ43490.1 MAG: hypothetical protein A2485_13440 [Bdellovibrionales bacterium RIFOXYC12_FULL_39_17]OFZ48963.1 MAG: hypothetical protein A2404_08630 [Bdellovibrionales bacterium RIFOXYC1_FULL_39_130]OFZ73362.1 MAG: hypothetical protein A2451_04455 [Bdellovibrionales bacterium RIFOXYC2_FULL_39_8]OFZ76230.1 MAG: hypothetical protein A2560_07750 [Bdellovibrionales bacterium RIFOXYD1_FULL_39_84]OFZ94465.1 MAG: